MLNRSRIEVAMGAEAHHPHILVVKDFGQALVGDCRESADTSEEIIRRIHALEFQVRNVNTQIEVLGHVPLRAGANPP